MGLGQYNSLGEYCGLHTAPLYFLYQYCYIIHSPKPYLKHQSLEDYFTIPHLEEHGMLCDVFVRTFWPACRFC